MNDLVADALKYLESHKDPIYASVEDCNYFRQLYKKPSPPPEPIIIQPPPAPVPVIIQPPPRLELPPPPPPPEPISVIVAPSSSQIKPKPFQTDWKAIFHKVTPELALLNDVPSDAIAKKINTRWKTKNQVAPISLLYYQETAEQKVLLDQIAIAIDVYFGPARLISAESIEKERQWEAFLGDAHLNHVICCDYTLWQLTALMKFYKEIPALKTRQLGEKPLFLLPDLSLYLKDPLLKRSLWKALCQTLSPSSSTKT